MLAFALAITLSQTQVSPHWLSIFIPGAAPPRTTRGQLDNEILNKISVEAHYRMGLDVLLCSKHYYCF